MSATVTSPRSPTVVASAIEDMPADKWKESEERHNAAVAAQVPGFVERVEAAKRSAGAMPAGSRRSVTVLNGVDVLEKSGFKVRALRMLQFTDQQAGE